jgi:hypothetical protein
MLSASWLSKKTYRQDNGIDGIFAEEGRPYNDHMDSSALGP